MLAAIISSCFYYQTAFTFVYGFKSRDHAVGLTGFDLHKSYIVAVIGDNINFSAFNAIISLNDTVSAVGKIFADSFLAKKANRSVLIQINYNSGLTEM